MDREIFGVSQVSCTFGDWSVIGIFAGLTLAFWGLVFGRPPIPPRGTADGPTNAADSVEPIRVGSQWRVPRSPIPRDADLAGVTVDPRALVPVTGLASFLAAIKPDAISVRAKIRLIGEWPPLPKRRIVRPPPERVRSIDTGHHLCRSTRHPCINSTRLVEDASHQDRYRRCRSSRRHPTATESPATSGSASGINCSAAGSARRTEAFLWYV